MSERPNLRALRRNWRRSTLPFWQKIQAAMRNNAIKMRAGSDCCGHHGEPGC